MYISSDRADCAFAIRTLGQRLSAPNADDWNAVQKLAAYMRSTAGYALHLTPKAKGYSILQDGTQHDGTNHLLETFSDSDWCGSHQNRRSMSAAVHFLDGAAVFFSCRGLTIKLPDNWLTANVLQQRLDTPGAQEDGDDYDDWQVVPMVRAWRAWAMVSSAIALSLGSWLWHVSSNARTDTDALPMAVAPAELGFREILLFMMYGFVERGPTDRKGKERASELVELQKLCDALWAEQKSDKDAKYWERMGKMEEEKRRKREEEKAAAEEKERKEQEARERLEKAAAEEEEKQKQKARETLEKAAEENERREAARKAKEEEAAAAAQAAAVAEEKARKAAAAEEQRKRKAATAAADERKKMEEAEAEERKEQEARKEKKRIEELEKELAELRGETRSEAGSTKGEEGKTEQQEQASSSTVDPETKSKGPPNPEQYQRGAPKLDEDTDRNFYAVFPYDGNDYQWKWNSDSCFWYYYDLKNRCWHKQEGKDVKGKQTCLSQESKWLQAKGKEKERTKEKKTRKVLPRTRLSTTTSKQEGKKQKEEEAAAQTSSEEDQQQESKSEERIKGLGPKKQRKERSKEEDEEQRQSKAKTGPKEQVKALGSLKQNAVPGTIVKLLAVTKGGPVEAQFLKEELCGLTHSHLEWPDGALRDDLLGKRQNDIMGKLENPEDQPIVDSWRCKDLFTEKTPNARVQKGKLWEPDEAEIRLIREEIAREQAGSELVVREREWRESLERLEVSGFWRIRGFLAKPLGDGWIELALREFYKEAQERVSSGFQDNWIEKCHLITGGDVREVKRLPDLDSVAGVQVHVRLLKLRPRKLPPTRKQLRKQPSEAKRTAQQAVEEAAENSETEVVEGLKVRRKEDGWLELAARTLDEYKNDMEILAVKVADGTVQSCCMKHAKGWSNELYQVNFKTGELNVPKGKKSVEADLARVQICLADD
ncbi:hypothetical protein AK812_SmicGene43442 [Symbiodinium microadriaticum]|uniref:Reticulocyte-binding protein 2-like a n=1 Tax=Symbiodinium microadriaticum TaxID=2951 RepID=A0A1Q9C104_SYMMI|nr:hypothetical protein AK812_SmicGene43442 [Symbiodinium microadriaticum]